jgi:hypothetical protein
VLSSDGRYVGYASSRNDILSTNIQTSGGAMLFDRTTGENHWVGGGISTAAQRAIAIYEPNYYFFAGTNVYVFNIDAGERKHIGRASADPAFTSDGSLVALHVASASSPHIYTFDPLTGLTNLVINRPLRPDALSISDAKVVSFLTPANVATADRDNTNDVYTISVADPTDVRLATTPTPLPRGSGDLIPTKPLLSSDGFHVYYLASTNSPIDLIPRTHLMMTQIASGYTVAVTSGADAEPGPFSTTRPISLAGGVVTTTTARDLVDSPFDKMHLIFSGVVPDSDADTLPDSWELQMFGTLDETASGDTDGDSLTNMEELLVGTNPASAASLLRMDVAQERNYLIIRAQANTTKPVVLEATEDLGVRGWGLFDAPSRREGDVWIYEFQKPTRPHYFRIFVQP